MSALPFEWFILLLRVVVIFLLYFFLVQIVRVSLREYQAIAANRQPGGRGVKSQVTGHLLVHDPGASRLRRGASLALEPVTLIGRDPRATICINDSFVSSEHVQLTWSDGSWWIDDVGSTNGTLVNGKQLTNTTTLHYGDRIQLGDVELELTP